MKIKDKIRGMILGHKSDSTSYINYYRKMGARIGEGTIVFQPMHTCIDETRPFLIDIGKNVQITYGTTILTHGYDWSVLKGVYGNVLGSAGKVTIGDNVFIGANSTILKGVTIGNNVIIGAGSLVNRDIPDNTVAAGNPARVICSLEDYYSKRLNAQLKEAKIVYRQYLEVYGKEPPEEVFYEFFWLFYPRDNSLPPKFMKQMKNVGNYEFSISVFKNTKPAFDGYNAFLEEMRR